VTPASAHSRSEWTFLALIGAQAAHSVEEYVGRLYDVFPPARFVSGLLSSDLRRGFIVANVGLVSLGLLCYLGPVRRRWASAAAVAWAWAALELANGTGHVIWSIVQRSYTPGVATAPLLLMLAVSLARQLRSV
jgi:Protein of unknown function with HXXEE motif